MLSYRFYLVFFNVFSFQFGLIRKEIKKEKIKLKRRADYIGCKESCEIDAVSFEANIMAGDLESKAKACSQIFPCIYIAQFTKRKLYILRFYFYSIIIETIAKLILIVDYHFIWERVAYGHWVVSFTSFIFHRIHTFIEGSSSKIIFSVTFLKYRSVSVFFRRKVIVYHIIPLTAGMLSWIM